MKPPIAFKKNYPFALWLFCCLAFFLFFRKPVDSMLDTLLVKPLLSRYENTLFDNGVLILLCVGIAIWLYHYGSGKFNKVVGLISLFFYVLMRSDSYWQFQPSGLYPLLKNWDFVAAALIVPGIIAFFKRKRAANHDPQPESFIEERPIESYAQDSFKRSSVAAEVARRISITPNVRSFAIGILGEYGSGKTSFINLIKTYLDPAKTEILDFNPWSAEGATNIQRDFFDQLSAKLYELNPRIANLIVDYSRKLSQTDSSFTKLVREAGLAGSLFTKKTYTDDFERINQLLENSGKKIVITIDDLDRLYKDEVMEVLRLIRNTANFSNIFYLVAYERSYIDEAIKSVNANAAGSFLDKIIQLEIPLPKREKDDLLDLLETYLAPFITAEHLEAYKTHIVDTGFRNKYNFAFERVFRQSRDVIKFINNFKITYQLLGTEVMFENLFVLELLKFRFPLIYDRLYEHRDDFIRDYPTMTSHEAFYELRTYNEDKEDLLLIKRTLRAEQHYSEADINLIGGLVNNLFFKFDRSKKARNAIIYPMFFERYFRYRLSGKELSEKTFRAAYDESLPGIKNYIDECEQKNMLTELGTRILQEKPADKEGYELKMKSLFYLGPKYIAQKGRYAFDHQAITNLIWNYDHNLDKQFYKKDEAAFRSFVAGLFSGAGFPYQFEHEVLYHVKDGKKDISLSRERIVELQTHYFSEHVGQAGLTKDAVFMFWWTKYEEFVPLPDNPNLGHHHEHIEKPIVAAMKDLLPEYDPFQFLKYTIKHDIRDKDIYLLQPVMLEIFDEPEELRALVAEHTLLATDVKAEYLALFDACKKQDFKGWVEFELNTALKAARNREED
ncbi:KAP family P-loop NTPase fold protein [Mucilaginibacter flavidus]|uniref:KAP family P-loop NTPase fold protein n=1 Tax=Mucilaginibacter flavidus TaxID=2949309 RepID=UPI002092ED03|nr:P-loop NTPase fold protein [Mucilaginibacter flavidus]MCO5948561.1 KAP family NTPase [Mucilaginibacter flavidus]